MNSGYLYVLTHPSDSNLYKIGQTTRHPTERLAEHNSRFEEYAGQVVKNTGQKWVLKTYIPVPDTTWAEAVFWGAIPLADIPYRRGVEVAQMEWKWIEAGLEAAKKAGIRPPPGPVADHVFAYRAWMKKRLKGRGIILVGHVRSKFGKSNFRCGNGHEWRTVPNHVAEGKGCPQCGMGETSLEEIEKTINAGIICLMTNPNKPGFIKIAMIRNFVELSPGDDSFGDWQMHRYRSVEEPRLAENLFWESLGYPHPNENEPVSVELSDAEEAFRDLHYRVVSKIALNERAMEISESS